MHGVYHTPSKSIAHLLHKNSPSVRWISSDACFFLTQIIVGKLIDRIMQSEKVLIEMLDSNNTVEGDESNEDNKNEEVMIRWP